MQSRQTETEHQAIADGLWAQTKQWDMGKRITQKQHMAHGTFSSRALSMGVGVEGPQLATYINSVLLRRGVPPLFHLAKEHTHFNRTATLPWQLIKTGLMGPVYNLLFSRSLLSFFSSLFKRNYRASSVPTFIVTNKIIVQTSKPTLKSHEAFNIKVAIFSSINYIVPLTMTKKCFFLHMNNYFVNR